MIVANLPKESKDAAPTIRLLERFDIAGKTFLDCGANVGLVTLAALNRFDKVIAVEAHPATYARLLMAVAPSHERVTTILAAVAAKSGDLMYISSPTNSTGATARATKRLKAPEPGYYRECLSVSINSLIERYRPDCIKMDIEGSEYPSIMSIASFSGINHMIVEFHGTRSAKWFSAFRAAKRRMEMQGLLMEYPTHINMLDDGKAAKALFFRTVFRRFGQ